MFSALRSELRAFLCWGVRLGHVAFDVVRAQLTPLSCSAESTPRCLAVASVAAMISLVGTLARVMAKLRPSARTSIGVSCLSLMLMTTLDLSREG